MSLDFDNLMESESTEKQAKLWENLLPFEYQSFSLIREERPEGFRFAKSIFSIKACFNGMTLHACGEAEDDETALTKAFSELTERTVMVKASQTNSSIQNSNGWAAHSDKELAKRNALLELIERDGYLKHWYTCAPFVEIQFESLPSIFKDWVNDELAHSEFPKLRVTLSTLGNGPVVTCYFLDRDGFGVCGHSTRETLTESIRSAIQEACRMAHNAVNGLYFKESSLLNPRGFKSTVKKTDKVDPAFHGVYYAYHESFPGWIFGPSLKWDDANTLFVEQLNRLNENCETYQFTNEYFEPFFVAYVTSSDCISLDWGHTQQGKILTELKRTNRFKAWNGILNLNPHPVP